MSFLTIDARKQSKTGQHFIRWALVLLAFLFVPSKGMGNDLELTVKAAYIYNFLQFIDWQRKESDAGNNPIKICVVGSHQFADALEALSSRQVAGRAIQIIPDSPDSHVLGGCRVVFIGQSAEGQLSRLLARLSEANVLTVSDIPQFARKGGSIGFFIRNGKVKIEINLNATRQAGLKVSAKLLEVARIVQ